MSVSGVSVCWLSSAMGLFQARILVWVAISYSRGSSYSGWTRISVFPALASEFFTTAPPGHTQFFLSLRICHFSVPPIYRSIQYVSFCVWCISLVLKFVGALEHDFVSEWRVGWGVFTVCGSLCPVVGIDCVRDPPSHLQKAVLGVTSQIHAWTWKR